MDTAWVFWLTLTWFTLTYLGLALGKVPGLGMDRASIALVGATLMLITGVLSFAQAVSPDSIDYKTLALLFGMMVVVGFLRLSGCFQHLSACALKRIRTPLALLAVTVTLSGVLSAFLINDIVCIALTPVVLHLARRLRCDPLPHLVALATAANIGSVGTITGNPQNIYIGSHSGIPYLRFAVSLLPVAALGLVLNFLVVAFVHRRSLDNGDCPLEGLVRGKKQADPSPEPDAQARESFLPLAGASGSGERGKTWSAEAAYSVPDPEGNGPARRAALVWLRRKSVAVGVVTVGLFFTGLPLELIALGAAAVLLVSRVKPAKVFGQIDWSLLVLFTGLFIVVHAFQVHVLAHWGVERWHWLLGHPLVLLSLVSAALSNLVSNVPAVLLMEPLLKAVPQASQEAAWLALAMSSTLAGNLTVLGSVANLIVVESACREGVTVSCWEYCKVGLPLTVLTLTLGIVWLQFVHY